MIRNLVLATALVLPAAVSAQDLRPAPAYFPETLVAINLAEALALACRSVGVDLFATQNAVMELEEKLETDGFDPDNPFAGMIDPAPMMRDLQQAFLDKYPIEGGSEAEVCTAANQEIAEETAIGKYLIADPE